MPLPPEVIRLAPELFRRVGIPYYQGFSPNSQRALSDIVEIGLGNARIVRKQAVDTRLRKALDGASHLDEFAAAFGFLEEAAGNYFAGRFGLVGRYLTDVASRRRQFNIERARLGLLSYALLDRHGDCVLPFLATVGVPRERAIEEFKERVRTVLLQKARAWQAADLPRNAAHREGVRLYIEYALQWGVEAPWPVRSHGFGAYRKKPTALDDKTLEGYFGRTQAYMHDLGLVGSQSRGAPLQLTSRGREQTRALAAEGFDPADDRGLSPSFEAIHDAFSIDFARYQAVFRPLTHATLERLAVASAFPGRGLTDWSNVPDIVNEYGSIVGALSESLSGSARLDAVRLAMFLYSLGVGVPAALAPRDETEHGLNDNAAIDLAVRDPKHFGLGHARSGRRFWSVSVLRR